MLFTVACVLRAKGQDRYSSLWVERLKWGVLKHCPLPHRFVCLSDVDVPCERIPLEFDYEGKGWWSKIELFRPELFEGQVLYLDLDTLVTGDVTNILALGGFWGVKDFNSGTLCSTAMSWTDRPDLSILHNEFMENPSFYMTKYDRFVPGSSIGDQGYIWDTLRKYNIGINFWPENCVISYKKQCRSAPPKDSVAVAFHGRPKMDEAGGWAQKQWENLSGHSL